METFLLTLGILLGFVLKISSMLYTDRTSRDYQNLFLKVFAPILAVVLYLGIPAYIMCCCGMHKHPLIMSFAYLGVFSLMIMWVHAVYEFDIFK